MEIAFETFEVLGTTDEVTSCDCCGRQDLKKTVALRFDGGEPVHFGTTCAAVAAKVSAASIRKAVAKVEKAKVSAALRARAAAFDAESKAWEAFLAESSGLVGIGAGIRALGGFTAARAAFRRSLEEAYTLERDRDLLLEGGQGERVERRMLEPHPGLNRARVGRGAAQLDRAGRDRFRVLTASCHGLDAADAKATEDLIRSFAL